MSINIIPRRSVTIEAWAATPDDLIRVMMYNRQVYYLRASAPRYGMKAKFWFDLEFMPDAIKTIAFEATKADVEWRSRTHYGYLVGETTQRPTNAELLQALAKNHDKYLLEELDYDLGIAVNFPYASSELRKWHDYNHVARIHPITREQARAEVASHVTP